MTGLRWGARSLVGLVLVLVLTIAGSGTALAATTHLVTSTGDSGPGTLRHAIAVAAPGDTIEITFARGDPNCSNSVCTITLTSGELTITKSLTITGPGASLLTIARAGDDSSPKFRIFGIVAPAVVTISGLTITNGFVEEGAGGGISNSGTLTLHNVVMFENAARGTSGFATDPPKGVGGAVFSTGTLNVRLSTIRGNVAESVGGGITSTGRLVMEQTSISLNRVGAEGGGLALQGSARISMSAISGNHVLFPQSYVTGGGGINIKGGDHTIENTTIEGNVSQGHGGGIFASDGTNDAFLHLTFDTISRNNAALEGPAIYFGNATAFSFSSIFVNGPNETPGLACHGIIIPHLYFGVTDDGSCLQDHVPFALGEFRDRGGFTRTARPDAQGARLSSGYCADSVLGRGGDPAGSRDQRGVPRPPNNLCDIGAYQRVTNSAVVPPAIVDLPSHATVEGVPLGPVEIRVTDRDDPPDPANLTVVARSNNQALVPDGALDIRPRVGDSGVRYLTATPVPGASGTADITVTVVKSNGLLASTTFKLTVLAVNDQPSFKQGADVTVKASDGKFERPWATDISAGSPSERGQAVTFLVVNANPSLFAEQPAILPDGRLTFTPAPNGVGTAILTVVLKDDGGTDFGGTDSSPPAIFRITVLSDIRPPLAADDAYPVTVATTLTVAAPGVLANDSDSEGRRLKALKVADPAHGSLALSDDGSFTYTPDPLYSGSDSFTYRVSNGASVSDIVTVRLTITLQTATTPVPCSPRPNPIVKTEQVGPGRLRVTVTAQTNAGLPTNSLSRLEFGAARNARVEVSGATVGAPGGPAIIPGQPAGTAGAFAVALAAGAQQSSFVVQRQAPGDFRVDLVIADGCHASGPYRTFVGGGAGLP